jgi:hypothetical protein
MTLSQNQQYTNKIKHPFGFSCDLKMLKICYKMPHLETTFYAYATKEENLHMYLGVWMPS